MKTLLRLTCAASFIIQFIAACLVVGLAQSPTTRPRYVTRGKAEPRHYGTKVIDTDERGRLPRAAGSTVDAVGRASRAGTTRSASTLRRTADKTTSYVIGRRDADILREVRLLLDSNQPAERWQATVSGGVVTLRVAHGDKSDPSSIVTAIRRIAGVRSVVVVIL